MVIWFDPRRTQTEIGETFSMHAPKQFTNQIVDRMVHHSGWVGCPIKLDDITNHLLKRSWIYYRPVGFMEIDNGCHSFVGSFLYGLTIFRNIEIVWKEKHSSTETLLELFLRKATENRDKWSEQFIRVPGSAFKSSAGFGNMVLIGAKKNLTRKELDILGGTDRIITMEEFIK